MFSPGDDIIRSIRHPSCGNGSFIVEHWTRSFRNQCASRDCHIQRFQDVEPRCIVSVSGYTARQFCLRLCRTCNETFTHQQFLAFLPIPFPWNAECLARIQFLPFFKSLVGAGWGSSSQTYRTLIEQSTSMLTLWHNNVEMYCLKTNCWSN